MLAAASILISFYSPAARRHSASRAALSQIPCWRILAIAGRRVICEPLSFACIKIPSDPVIESVQSTDTASDGLVDRHGPDSFGGGKRNHCCLSGVERGLEKRRKDGGGDAFVQPGSGAELVAGELRASSRLDFSSRRISKCPAAVRASTGPVLITRSRWAGIANVVCQFFGRYVDHRDAAFSKPHEKRGAIDARQLGRLARRDPLHFKEFYRHRKPGILLKLRGRLVQGIREGRWVVDS